MSLKKNKDFTNNIAGVGIRLGSHENANSLNFLANSQFHEKKYWGEVTKFETLNYRTYKPEMGGLFCEKIFGPMKDWECHCGKYKTYRYEGVTCDKCGVDVTEKIVRRERMGYIRLAIPVVHPWYFRSLSNKIGLLLGINSKNLEKIIYYEKLIVIQPGEASTKGIKPLELLAYDRYYEICSSISENNASLNDQDPNKFIAMISGEAIELLLKKINLDTLYTELRERSTVEKSQINKADLLKRIKVVTAFKDANTDGRVNKPEWMVIRVLPVIPAGLRPLVQLDGGKIATSGLNELYKLVIIRNNRLSRLLDIKAPIPILKNEKRMLQEAIDALMEKQQGKEREGKVELKSLSETFKGKQGLFRQNLLGKRVDYSGRSVIVVGPELKLYECGLPKDMAIELFKPFVINKLLKRRIVDTVKSAKKLIDKKAPIIWELLEIVITGHPVLLNRAPTLHRLGIQAFQPKLIEGKAIQLHPLLCTAFNADFDGDQMAVHVPLGNEAIVESLLLLLSSQNIFNSANGKATTLHTKDMVLGAYYMTKMKPSYADPKKSYILFSSLEEISIALSNNKVGIHEPIRFKARIKNEEGKFETQLIQTTPGRVQFNQYIPEEIGYINETITGKKLQELVFEVHHLTDTVRTVQFLDDIKKLGFEYAYISGISMGLDNVRVPDVKPGLVEYAYQEVEEILYNYSAGLITPNERYNKIIDVWISTSFQISSHSIRNLEMDQDGFNPMHMMIDSGARGSKEQVRQLCGIRGLMTKPQKNASGLFDSIIETPILSNLKEGLDVIEYFISAHGARKGLADTALKTADAGYLTRKLVEVSQNVIVTEIDCGTLVGISEPGFEIKEGSSDTLADFIANKVALKNIYHPLTKARLVASGEVIDFYKAQEIEDSGLKSATVRSIFKCLTRRGVCAKCYGVNLATGHLAHIGDAVGIVAAQAIGEPGTQLTLRTFHVGGVATKTKVDSSMKSNHNGIIQFKGLTYVKVKAKDNEIVYAVLSRSCEASIIDPTTKIVLSKNNIAYGCYLKVQDGDLINKGQTICYWDPYNAVILSEKSGKVVYESIEEGVTYIEELDEHAGKKNKIIIESKNKEKSPIIKLITDNGDVLKYNLPVKARLVVSNSQIIHAGQAIYKIPRFIGKSSDMIGGLPRVTELLEVRRPAGAAILSDIDGVVVSCVPIKGNLEVYIESKHGIRKHYLLPLSRYILVQQNDYVKAGDPLTDGVATVSDLLDIKGLTYIQQRFITQLQDVYKIQGVKINNKHMEVVVSQMLARVEVVYGGDTTFLSGQLVHKYDFKKENDFLMYKKVILDPGDSKNFRMGQMISSRDVDAENKALAAANKACMVVRPTEYAIAKFKLQGITKASLVNSSFLAAASFQESSKILSDAVIRGDQDRLEGLKECVIVGKLIPAGTGFKSSKNLVVSSKSESNLK